MRVEEIVSSLLSKIEDVQNKRITAQADLLDALGRFQLAKESEEEAINTQALSAGEISALRSQLLQFNEQEMAYKEQLKHFQALLSLAQPPAEEPAPEEPVTDPTAEENPAEGELPLDDPPLPAEEEIPPVEGDGGGL